MSYGVDAPNFAHYGDAGTLAALARKAEDAGWDGFFIWDHVLLDHRLALVGNP